jgi:hypothetical protein
VSPEDRAALIERIVARRENLDRQWRRDMKFTPRENRYFHDMKIRAAARIVDEVLAALPEP